MKHQLRKILCGLGLLACFAALPTQTTLAEVSLPSVFSDHMVLQRGVKVPVFGFANPGEEIEVSFADQSAKTSADNAGKWRVDLPVMKASKEGRTLTVTGDNTVKFEDVLVGDVWICSGQSNMEWNVEISANPKEEIAAADYPSIRLFNVEGHTVGVVPREDCKGQWRVCSPETVKYFSAVGYFFGRELNQETDVPVGLLGTNWGGTRIEPWTPPVGFRNVPELANISKELDTFATDTEEGQKTWQNYLQAVQNYAEQATEAMAKGRALPDPVVDPGYRSHTQPSTIYNAMVHPLVPYAFRGAIWYQGESNGSEHMEYYHKMRALIEGWRTVWAQDDFPIYFYYVQLANFMEPNKNPAGGDGWAKVREAQTKSLEIPHTGMAVIIDIGEANDIHPKNKQDVGKRLARWALRDVFNKEIVVSGPIYRQMKVDGTKAIIEFDHAGTGLMVGKKDGLNPTEEAPDESVKQLSIADKDGKWYWAESKIDGDKLIVWSDEVAEPAAVRYGFSMNPEGANLYNKEGLPASPFRTDSW